MKVRGKPVTFLRKYKIVRLEKLQKLQNNEQADIFNEIKNYILDHNNNSVYAVLNRNKVISTNNRITR
jgi:hypothetical protein